MQRRKLGANGPEVGAIGLGCMGMSDFYGPADRAESIATIHAALDSGATLIDTGDFYGSGHNELLISEALKGRRREDYVLSVKFGALRDPAGGFIGYDARPEATKNFLAYTLKRTRSTSIGRRGSIPTFRSRTRSARSSIWSRSALCGRSGSPRSAHRPSAAPRRFTRSPICRSNIRSSCA